MIFPLDCLEIPARIFKRLVFPEPFLPVRSKEAPKNKEKLRSVNIFLPFFCKFNFSTLNMKKEFEFFEYPNNNTKKPKYLVILLHGYGANGAGLIELGKEFAHLLPDAHFLAPNAHLPWEGGFVDSYQWFSLAAWGPERDVKKVADEIRRANDNLRAFIYQQLKRFDLTEKELFIVGFSQGAMMAMYQGFSAQKPVAGVISYSGKVVLPEFVGEKTLSKPPILLTHGVEDDVLTFSNFEEGESILQGHGVDFEAQAFDGLGHTIDIRGIRAAERFFKARG